LASALERKEEMIREIVLDTETTGLDPADGHRLVELGCVELVNHVRTGRDFHSYINPEREVPEDARRIHGLSTDFLRGYPVFVDVVDAFLEFIGDSPLLIHNAKFDVTFLNAELARAGRAVLATNRATCTLLMAQKRFPGAPASLDALCRRFGVDNSVRTKHGAIVDSELLAEVYLHLLGGRQVGLELVAPTRRDVAAGIVVLAPRPPRPHAPSEAELAAHAALLSKLDDPIWLQ
jgi:DNA polymerase-3 subunit epsilon